MVKSNHLDAIVGLTKQYLEKINNKINTGPYIFSPDEPVWIELSTEAAILNV